MASAIATPLLRARADDDGSARRFRGRSVVAQFLGGR
jgi:hypothetical protein